MENIITYDNLNSFAYTNEHHLKGDIKGIVIRFRGLGSSAFITDDAKDELSRAHIRAGLFHAEHGILFFVPYLDPWCWMNEQAVKTTDRIVDVIFEHYSLPKHTPIAVSGGSMGGMGALVYTYYAKRTPIACAASCPVCDVPFHYTERPDLPRSFYCAYAQSKRTLEQELRAHSPLHLAKDMPKAKYFIVHCEQDMAVNIHSHSEKLVKALSEGHELTYITVPEHGHCSLTPEANELYEKHLTDAILSYKE